MNQLHRIWQSPNAKSTIQGEEEDVGNTSLADSASTKSSFHAGERKGVLDYSLNELDISEEEVAIPDVSSKPFTKAKVLGPTVLHLASAIPAAELATKTREMVVQRIVNLSRGFIDVQQLAFLIISSCRTHDASQPQLNPNLKADTRIEPKFQRTRAQFPVSGPGAFGY